MTDEGRLYVLTTDNRWYYYDGSTWVAGGEYGAVATDKTLTMDSVPADAEVTGDKISALENYAILTQEQIAALAGLVESDG